MKQILLSILLCLASLSAYAQYYYNNTKTFVEDGYTYQCDALKPKSGGDLAWVTLYNKANKYMDVDVVNKHTGVPVGRNEEHEKVFVEDMSIPPQVEKIICSAFTEEQKKDIQTWNMHLAVILHIETDDGSIADVVFQFLSYSAFGKIPVSVYRKIEVDLKKQIRFKLIEAGKKRNYLYFGITQEIE